MTLVAYTIMYNTCNLTASFDIEVMQTMAIWHKVCVSLNSHCMKTRRDIVQDKYTFFMRMLPIFSVYFQYVYNM